MIRARKLEPAIMQLYCRIAAEIGADLVKCVWSGSVDTMQAIVESCPVPVLVAGGARNEVDPASGVRMAREAILAGCRGLVFGRTIYQSPDPGATLDELRRIVHGSDRAA